MPEEIHENELPPEKPALKMSLKGFAIAVLGAVLLALLLGAVLRVWD